MAGICFVCGKRLLDALGRPIVPVVQQYHGNEIKMHQTCAKSHSAAAPLTARASTTELGSTLAEDGVKWSSDHGGLVNVIHKRFEDQ